MDASMHPSSLSLLALNKLPRPASKCVIQNNSIERSPHLQVNVRSSLQVAAAVSVLVVGLLSSRQLLRLARQPYATDGDNLYLTRFESVKSALPQRGVICYMPDPDGSFEAKKHYFLAQYALAPLVLRATPDCDPVLADFPAGAAPDSILGRQFVVLRDFGNGLMLLRRNTGQ